MKLYTIPFAGGSSYSFSQWMKYLEPKIQVINLEYSGHGKRLGQELYKNLDCAITDMVHMILSDNNKKKSFSIYGHSMGGIVAYQTSLILQQKYGIKPDYTLIGACLPPHNFNRGEKRNVSSKRIIDGLVHANRLTRELAESNEFKKFFYPVIENDYSMISQYKYEQYQNRKLENRLVCLYGAKDGGTSYDNVQGWDRYAEKPVEFIKINGKHFFVEDCTEEVCEVISSILTENK